MLARSGQQGRPVIQKDEAYLLESLVRSSRTRVGGLRLTLLNDMEACAACPQGVHAEGDGPAMPWHCLCCCLDTKRRPERHPRRRPIAVPLCCVQTHVTSPIARPLPRKHAGALLAHDLVKRAAVGAVSAARPQPGPHRDSQQTPATTCPGESATAAEASQQAGAELLTWLNNAVPGARRTTSPAGKGGAAAEPPAAPAGQPLGPPPPADSTPLRRPVSDSHLWVRAHTTPCIVRPCLHPQQAASDSERQPCSLQRSGSWLSLAESPQPN